MSHLQSEPVSPMRNNILQPLGNIEGTPVGDRDRAAKIQLCVEIRNREVAKKKQSSRSKSKSDHELVLEVTVMHLKNLSRGPEKTEAKKKPKGRRPTFVKVQLVPGELIYSTELKMDKQNEDKVDLNFIEVFAFPLESADILKNKKLEVLVCNTKMTRNASLAGQVVIDVSEYKIGKPICKWFTVSSSQEEPPAKP